LTSMTLTRDQTTGLLNVAQLKRQPQAKEDSARKIVQNRTSDMFPHSWVTVQIEDSPMQQCKRN